jgi:hypothetical protein
LTGDAVGERRRGSSGVTVTGARILARAEAVLDNVWHE